ncbi:LysR family transcriptional regulator [Halomonas heilongjiangensis]|uniref:LysR family transcriptional regulator n=1 Tax=Halomonas heilongjiangensis TaxID=1387883 RepID=A0A2N7TJE6_9GAMM|nr:LysR family transcriptional regulator [Halomonas heilongjiangensis]PMR68321.1 LysR family transcriptional regulator [Halomonas heilongjiangensis]PXX89055.1 LysR family transcriptional regulator [Halomonas heilongjiangensis]
MLSQRALAYLNEVVRRGSLRRAAAQLDVDASAISRQLRALEEELGVALCERHGGGMRATQAGHLLVQHYHAQRSAEEAVLSQLMALQGLARGEVRIAVGEGFIADLISAPLDAFMKAFEGIDIEIRMAGVNEAISLVKDMEVDLALLYAPPVDPTLHCHVETRQPLDLIVPPGHPLLDLSRPVTLRDLESWPLGLMDNPFGMRQMVNLVAQQERVHLEARLHTNSVAVLKNFVRSGIGVTFMPELTVIDEIERGEIHALPLAYPVMSDARAQIVSRRGRELTVAARTCVAHLHRGMRFFHADAPRLARRPG